MRIVFLTGEYPPQPGGVGDYTHRLATTLADYGQAVLVMTAHADVCCVYQLPQQHLLHTWVSSTSHWSWRRWADIMTMLALVHPHLLHIQYQTGAYGMHPSINLLPWRLRGLPQSPHVFVTFHDLLEPYLFPKAGWLRRYVTLRMAHDAHGVIVTNVEDRMSLQPDDTGTRTRRLLPGWSLKRHRPPAVIPIGSNIPVAPPAGYTRQAWRAQLGVSPDTQLIAYFGLLSRSKGVDLLLEALGQLDQATTHTPPYRLVLIGAEGTTPQDQAYASEIAAQITRLGLQTSVVRTGQVDAPTVSAHLLAADCVVLPFRDGASFRRGSLLAALEHGAAVVTTRPKHPAYLVPPLVDGEHALLVPPENSFALAQAIHRLWHDHALRERLGAGGRSLTIHFTWPAIAQQHLQVYTLLT